MEEYKKCIFCDYQVSVKKKDFDKEIYYCYCDNCGRYRITYQAIEDLPDKIEFKKFKYLISGYIREMTELGLSAELIRTDNYENLALSSIIPKTTMEKLDKLLLSSYRRTEYLFEDISNVPFRPAQAYAKNQEELENMKIGLVTLNYASRDNFRYYLTLKGIERAEKLKKEEVKSRQCFVALWFDESMMTIYDNDIFRAIKEVGYDPLCIVKKEYNDDICDEIIAEIRRSKFLVADFTGQRGGVYFEAGFAYGLGLPVIWTCRKDDLDKLHFDIDHYNFIDWENGEELYTRLKNRISATIL